MVVVGGGGGGGEGVICTSTHILSLAVSDGLTVFFKVDFHVCEIYLPVHLKILQL